MKAQRIYDITMALIDEMLDNGNVDYNSTRDYTARTPGILTIVDTEIYNYLNTYGADVDLPEAIFKMEDEVEYEDDICQGVLPYLLASRLLMQEDESVANRFYSLGMSSLNTIAENMTPKAKVVERDNVYGLCQAGD